MATDRLITQLPDLKTKIESARAEWHTYIKSRKSESPQLFNNTREAPQSLHSASIESRVTAIWVNVTSLQQRLNMLSMRGFPIPSYYALGTTAELIETHLPSRICGLETVNSFVRRAIFSAEARLIQVLDFIEDGEAHILERFDVILRLTGILIDAVSTGVIATLAFTVVALFEEYVNEPEGSDRIARRMRETKEAMSQCVELLQVQIVLLMKCAHSLGVKLPRQRLLTEFVQGGERRGLSTVLAAFDQYEERIEFAARYLGTLDVPETIPASQSSIKEFFSRQSNAKQTLDAGPESRAGEDGSSGESGCPSSEDKRRVTSNDSLGRSRNARAKQRLITEYFKESPDAGSPRDVDMKDNERKAKA